MHPLIVQQLTADHINEMIARAADWRQPRQVRRARPSRTSGQRAQRGLPRTQAEPSRASASTAIAAVPAPAGARDRGHDPVCLLGPRDGWLAEETRTVERIRTHRPRAWHERPWHEALPPDPRDPMWPGPRDSPVPVIAPAENRQAVTSPGLARRRTDELPSGG